MTAREVVTQKTVRIGRESSIPQQENKYLKEVEYHNVHLSRDLTNDLEANAEPFNPRATIIVF